MDKTREVWAAMQTWLVPNPDHKPNEFWSHEMKPQVLACLIYRSELDAQKAIAAAIEEVSPLTYHQALRQMQDRNEYHVEDMQLVFTVGKTLLPEVGRPPTAVPTIPVAAPLRTRGRGIHFPTAEDELI